MELLSQIKDLQKTEINTIVEKRLSEFRSFKERHNDEWFSELCFCILTANSKALTGIAIQKELTHVGFLNNTQEELSECIRRNKHRFHNNKSKYIVEARKYANIKDIVNEKLISFGEKETRNFIADNIKGLGYKEASHFLRNTGHENLAILDRHILNLMHENNLIVKPNTLTRRNYLEFENKFNSIASELNITPAKLDLLMWYIKTGKVLK